MIGDWSEGVYGNRGGVMKKREGRCFCPKAEIGMVSWGSLLCHIGKEKGRMYSSAWFIFTLLEHIIYFWDLDLPCLSTLQPKIMKRLTFCFWSRQELQNPNVLLEFPKCSGITSIKTCMNVSKNAIGRHITTGAQQRLQTQTMTQTRRIM